MNHMVLDLVEDIFILVAMTTLYIFEFLAMFTKWI